MDSLSVLLIRTLVGLILGVAGAFVGMLFNGLLVPSPVAGDEVAFIVRMLVLAIGAATAGLMAWASLTETRIGTVLAVLAAIAAGTGGAIAAYYLGDAILDHPDLYILNKQLSQVVLFGAVLGANASNVTVAFLKFRARRGLY